MTHLTPQQFARDFTALFSRSAYRLETLDYYVADNEQEPYRRFLTGQPQDPHWRAPWKQLVRAARAAGKTMARVHAVSEPLSTYLKFEITCSYPGSAEAGEDVRILRRQNWPWLRLPDRDYWLFDDRAAAVMEYGADGNWLAVSMTTDAAMLRYYRQARDTAMEHAEPLTTYLESLKETV